MSDDVWDHIFLGKELKGSTNIPRAALTAMRREFDYWYPFDMRVAAPLPPCPLPGVSERHISATACKD